MKLKRYTTQELQELVLNLFFEYMLNEGVDKVKLSYEEKIQNYESTFKLYQEALTDGSLPEETKMSIIEQIGYLAKGIQYLTESCMKSQKRIYEKTSSTDFCRSTVQVPLNKKINSFYDDLYAEVVFYDDVCTPMGKHEEYIKLTSKEEQIEFLMRNTEITNIGLVYERNSRRVAILELLGSLNYDNERVQNSGVVLLGKEFSDFENLTLKNISTIQNNDLKQWLQTKIDLDKENMRQLARTFIRGDYYSILQPANSPYLYIRYVCRSTGRVYYNILNLDNLRLSEYFEEDNYESYSKAWWNLTHLGSKVEGKPIIAS